MINAIKNANMPKFISDDVNLFERILADIFPEMKPPAPDHIALEVNKGFFMFLLGLNLY